MKILSIWKNVENDYSVVNIGVDTTENEPFKSRLSSGFRGPGGARTGAHRRRRLEDAERLHELRELERGGNPPAAAGFREHLRVDLVLI